MASIGLLQSTKMWTIASYLAGRLGREENFMWKPGDVAGIAMEMMAAPRNDEFPGELERENDFAALSERLMEHISQAFGISKLRHDRTLQNGLLNNIVPACFRQRFNLWFPVALNNAGLPEKYEKEHAVAGEVSELVHELLALPSLKVKLIISWCS